MSRVVKPSVAVKTGGPRGGQDVTLSLPAWIPLQLCQPVENAPSGPQWLHEIKLDGFRMAARIDHGRAQLLTRTGLDWSDKYPSLVAALANVKAKTAYLDGNSAASMTRDCRASPIPRLRPMASAGFGLSITPSISCT
jgi:ATP-dependent DNA ligase